MENSVKKREWVKTAAIILLAVLLVLTFFSKTIMNASLPEVATQQTSSGAINARIRGTGTVEASEVYSVTIKQTRKVASVLVKSGQEITAGDTLFVLEAEESDELQQAEDELASLQQSYNKSLIEAGNSASQENYEVQKARDAYNEALAVYNQYSTADASQLATQKAAAEAKLKDLQTQRSALETQLSKLKADTEYTDAQAVVSEHEATIKTLEAEKETLLKTITVSDKNITGAENIQKSIDWIKGLNEYVTNQAIYKSTFSKFCTMCDNDTSIMNECRKNETAMLARMNSTSTSASSPDEQKQGLQTYAVSDLPTSENEQVQTYWEAYDALYPFYYGGTSENGNYIQTGLVELENEYQVAVINDKLAAANQEMRSAQTLVENFEYSINTLNDQIDALELQITDQQSVVDKLSSASSAAETVKSTKKALEDLLFQQGLGDASSIDMEAAQKAIEKKEAEIEKLRENADELEVKANVSGTIDTVYASAGKSIGGEEQPLATINVTDRGFTVKIDVTMEQAKKVKTGDTAELVNFWGGDATATLEQIAPSQTSGSRTLVFALTGDIQAGQNITLSIGQKSSNYDALIPLSALREDTNGKFVYVLTSKSSPLGTRYIATRVTVQELARDDQSAAVSGISAGDFVITTSNKPVEAGKQVRLADNA